MRIKIMRYIPSIIGVIYFTLFIFINIFMVDFLSLDEDGFRYINLANLVAIAAIWSLSSQYNFLENRFSPLALAGLLYSLLLAAYSYLSAQDLLSLRFCFSIVLFAYSLVYLLFGSVKPEVIYKDGGVLDSYRSLSLGFLLFTVGALGASLVVFIGSLVSLVDGA